MKVLGITGGVGSGKSKVLKYLETEYNAVVVQLDEVAKKLQRRGQPCYEQIVAAFGETVVGADRELARDVLGQIVFADAGRLEILNQIVHPAVKQWVEEDISAKKQEQIPLYIIEAALLPNAGYVQICDEMWYIFTEETVRRGRLEVSRGYTQEQITRMIETQPDEEMFRRVCHVVIDNSGTFEQTKQQIDYYYMRNEEEQK